MAISPDDVKVSVVDDEFILRVEGVPNALVSEMSYDAAVEELRLIWVEDGHDLDELDAAIHPSDEWLRRRAGLPA
jgi:hypothetical protein